MKKTIAALLALCLLLAGCANASTDLTKDIAPGPVPEADLSVQGPVITQLGLSLLQNSAEEGKNALISPLSVMMALSMAANGADNETLSQMETVLGGDIATLNSYLKAYPQDMGEQIHVANSLWIKDIPSLTVRDSFLQITADYYGAGAFLAPFDSSTVKDINGWVEENTGGQIKDMLDQIPPEAVMYLVNALAFDAEWDDIYQSYEVSDSHFTTETGQEREVSMMYSKEHAFLETRDATGFIKYYEGGRFAFVALLPNEGTTVGTMLQNMDIQELRDTMTAPRELTVHAALPKFETEYDIRLEDILAQMGMSDAFDPGKADFSRMASSGDGSPLYIGRVLHKTRISVAEEGTQAGAATMAEMALGAAAPGEEETRTVRLDRPFLYMVVDTELWEPIFIGILADPQ